ncbi:uncharacterized protein LOC131950915 isoform X2 [Physella acuta]|uniref:uncharacterized protein LOC131950915 isoform X2 n=1 Tax=Physella acuta TaxID=109671 RepID=UPI0027DAF854|nr:uncharacterized protein LOC131950915 isoform X2 [Physella acuta]
MMALSQQSRKYLQLLVVCLQEQQSELQGVLDQFIKQTVTKARSWIEAPDQGNMSFSDIHVMLSGASGKLLETINFYTGTSAQLKSPTKQYEKPSVTLNESAYSNEEMNSRLVALEDFISGLKQAKLESKEEGYEMKQWKEAVTTQQQEMEARYGVVTNILLQRLMPIEKLLQVINTQEVARAEKCKEFRGLQDDVATLKAEVLALNLKTQRNANVIGFSASFRNNVPLVKNCYCYLLNFDDVTLNSGNHFNPATGKFTAPVDGLYAASFCLHQCNDGVIDVRIYHTLNVFNTNSVSMSKTTRENSTGVCSTAVLMKKGEFLSLAIKGEGNASLSYYSQFTCFLIST